MKIFVCVLEPNQYKYTESHQRVSVLNKVHVSSEPYKTNTPIITLYYILPVYIVNSRH